MPLIVFPLLPCPDDNAEDKIKKGTMGRIPLTPQTLQTTLPGVIKRALSIVKKYHQNLIKITLKQM
ncbi:Hypothetical protein GbCGDNIH7_7286 [Granulibacter bethesdensis]|nr:Hypothetical protein GbCGDNIH7_7286 [Granulibacter bethesdensis]